MSKVNKELKLRGDMAVCTEWMRKNQIYTKQELIQYMMDELGMDHEHATYKAIILLTPRETSERGDCRGHTSNRWGHIAYNEKLPRRIVDGKKEPQRYRFRFRDVELEPRMYPYQKRKMKTELEKVQVTNVIEETLNTETV
jgi:hypothetical protein